MTEEEFATALYVALHRDAVCAAHFADAYRQASDVGHTKVFIANPFATDVVAFARKFLADYTILPNKGRA